MINTKNELKKLIIKKKYPVITIISALICMLRLGGNVLIAKVSGGEVVIKSNLVISMLAFVTDILIPIIVFMAVTDLFAGEVQEDTMKASLMRPLTRFRVMTSKSLAVFILSCAVMLIMFAVSLVIQILSGNSLAAAGAALASYLIDMIPVMGIIALALLINMVAKSPTLAMLLCIVAYIFFKYLNYYVSPLGQMVFTAYSQWHKIWIGATLPLGAMLSKIGILLGSVLILYTVSYIIFERKDM